MAQERAKEEEKEKSHIIKQEKEELREFLFTSNSKDTAKMIKNYLLCSNLYADLSGKKEIELHEISPTIDVPYGKKRLAGEFLAHFGGFFSKRCRENDFNLGRLNASYWLKNKMKFEYEPEYPYPLHKDT